MWLGVRELVDRVSVFEYVWECVFSECGEVVAEHAKNTHSNQNNKNTQGGLRLSTGAYVYAHVCSNVGLRITSHLRIVLYNNLVAYPVALLTVTYGWWATLQQCSALLFLCVGLPSVQLHAQLCSISAADVFTFPILGQFILSHLTMFIPNSLHCFRFSVPYELDLLLYVRMLFFSIMIHSSLLLNFFSYFFSRSHYLKRIGTFILFIIQQMAFFLLKWGRVKLLQYTRTYRRNFAAPSLGRMFGIVTHTSRHEWWLFKKKKTRINQSDTQAHPDVVDWCEKREENKSLM